MKVQLKVQSQEKTVSLLLSGKHPETKKYAGSHVLIIDREIVPLKKGKEALADIARLEKKYGKTPIMVFVPRPDISYILFLCQE